MSGMCITGASRHALRHVLGILQGAGMAAPVGGQAELSHWHEQVLASQTSANARPALEHAALRIVAANAGSPLWGWADSCSFAVLDWWRDLAPDMCFVLVCERPEVTIARAIEMDSEPADPGIVMNYWRECHTQLLRFRHRNSARTVLVDARECAEYPGALLEHCSRQWGLPLHMDQQSMLHRASPEAESALENAPDPLTIYLARRFCAQDPRARELQLEIAATIVHLNEREPSPAPARSPENPVAIVDAYRDMRRRAAHSSRLEVLSRTFEVELAGLKRRVAEAEADWAIQRDAAEARISEAAQQSELLLAQLLQMQEEAEAAQKSDAAQKERLQAAEFQVTEVKRREELLQLQLKQVQEELVHHFKQRQDLQRRLGVAEGRLQRVFRNMPEYHDFDSVEISRAEGGATQATTWLVKNFSACGRNFDRLEFTTTLTDGVAAFAIPDLERVEGPVNPCSTPADVLRRISSSDWQMLKTLSRLLSTRLEPSSQLQIPACVQPDALRSGLLRFEAALREFPATLRYDTVHLKREQVNPDYEHLWLRFESLQYGACRLPHFEFRLSCAHVRPGEFGRFPKLEFPQDTGRPVFENWFIEAHDDFGPKLELRFALPEPSLDVEVWRRVSSRDRAFMLSILERLPAILSDLRGSGALLRRGWEDWMKMAGDMHQLAEAQTRLLLVPEPLGTRLTREFSRMASQLGIVAMRAQDATKSGGRS